MKAIQHRFSAERLADAAQELLDASHLCAVSTVGANERAHIHIAQFGWAENFELVWVSDQDTVHSRNLEVCASTAIAVFDSHQGWGDSGRGIQLFGTAREEHNQHAQDIFARRFPYERDAFPAYRLYLFRPASMKLLHEADLGEGLFVTARVTNGALSWERTDQLIPDQVSLTPRA